MTDLRIQPPRRWNETVAGYLWLPRPIDKIRAFQTDTLGAYAYPSYLDRVFLRRLGLSPAFIERAVTQSESDEAVGRAVCDLTGHTLEQIQRMNESFERSWRFFLALIDNDAGYVKGPGRWAVRKVSAQQL